MGKGLSQQQGAQRKIEEAMKYREKNGKWIFEKDGVFFSMTKDQLREMRRLCSEILGDTEQDEAEEAFFEATKRLGW